MFIYIYYPIQYNLAYELQAAILMPKRSDLQPITAILLALLSLLLSYACKILRGRPLTFRMCMNPLPLGILRIIALIASNCEVLFAYCSPKQLDCQCPRTIYNYFEYWYLTGYMGMIV